MTSFISKVVTNIITLTQQKCGKCNHKPEQIEFYKKGIEDILHSNLQDLLREVKGEKNDLSTTEETVSE